MAEVAFIKIVILSVSLLLTNNSIIIEILIATFSPLFIAISSLLNATTALSLTHKHTHHHLLLRQSIVARNFLPNTTIYLSFLIQRRFAAKSISISHFTSTLIKFRFSDTQCYLVCVYINLILQLQLATTMHYLDLQL